MAALSWRAVHCPRREGVARLGYATDKKKAPETRPEPSTWVSGDTPERKPDEPEWSTGRRVQSR